MKKQDTSENLAKKAYLALGSNLGNKINNIEIAKFELEKYRIKILKFSSNYISESWPDPIMPNYINIVIIIKTILKPIELLKICNLIELKLGRVRSKQNAPRVCDIDIIDYDKQILNEKNSQLILPHPRMDKRNFVLLPLFEVDKSWKHPVSKINIVNLINSLEVKDLRSIKKI
ncbi:2-amino-4-hydroxy-6-hydroxymethyldihydropteridine diphosphokinase [Candidatus Pelagibacter sp. Uisw_092]|uniref:2-amino-4-hydroxy-6- hydroxymethyldihydropteridine diphosphokinase n=1 Tax=Candidatus Pelagibacter sp. Uisw_092 TaxID=3230979 RepID=UPI0039EBA5AA